MNKLETYYRLLALDLEQYNFCSRKKHVTLLNSERYTRGMILFMVVSPEGKSLLPNLGFDQQNEVLAYQKH
jgi:hypothetical protein